MKNSSVSKRISKIIILNNVLTTQCLLFMIELDHVSFKLKNNNWVECIFIHGQIRLKNEKVQIK